MKKIILLPALTFFLVLTSCGPAAEDRQAMHIRAKVFQDSIAAFIRASMAEAEAPGPNAGMLLPTPAPQATPMPAGAQQTPQPVNPNIGVGHTK